MKIKIRSLLTWIQKYQNYGYILLAYLLALGIFRFSGLMNFYDLVTVPYVHNFTDESVVWPYNFLRDLGFSPHLITSLLFQLIFTATTVLSYFSLKKILPLLNKGIEVNNLQIFLISLIYTYNPWTFERFLMGQYKVLAGTGMLIWGIYEIFKLLANQDFNTSKQNILSFLKVGLIIGFIGYVGSLHSAGFLFIYFGLNFIILFYCSWNQIFKKPLKYIQKVKSFVKFVFLSLGFGSLLVIPTAILQATIYLNTNQFSFFQQNLSLNLGQVEEIIRSFQVRTHAVDQNIYVRAIIGSGGWMQSVKDLYINPIQQQLSWVSNYLYYFNNTISILLIMIVFLWLVYFIVRLGKSQDLKTNFLISLFITLGIALILNFGYAGGFEIVNQWFYKIPLSYTYREAGKFYALFLACLLILVALFLSHRVFWSNKIIQQPYLNKIVNIFLLLIFFSNYLLFIPIPNVLKPTIFPKILTDTESRCHDNYKILAIPISIHATTDYNPVPHINPVKYLINCPFVSVEQANVRDISGTKSIIFSQNEKALAFQKAISEVLSTKDIKIFISFLRQEKVGILIINTFSTQEAKDLNTVLIQQKWDYQRDGSTYIYYLPGE